MIVIDSCSLEYVGGNSYFTAGAFRTVHGGLHDVIPLVSNVSSDQIDQTDIEPYTQDEFAGDIMRMSDSQSDSKVVETLVQDSRETIQWLKDHVGVRFILSFNRQAFLVDGRQKFWGGMVLATINGGKSLMDDHIRKAKETGIDFWHSCRAMQLLFENGVVKGVLVNHGGKMKTLHAKGVVLACGGFEADRTMRQIHLGQSWARAKVRILNTSVQFNSVDRFAEHPIISGMASIWPAMLMPKKPERREAATAPAGMQMLRMTQEIES